MAWVAVDRAVRTVEEFGLEGPARPVASVARRDPRRGVHARATTPTWVPSPSTTAPTPLDASLLMIPLVGFLPADDNRVRSTVEAIERELTEDGFVLRYRTQRHRGGRRSHRPRGCLPGLLVLDGRLPASDRPPRRRPGDVRAAPQPAQRPRAAVRGVRRRGRTPGGELPPGVLPRVARQRRLQPDRASRHGGAGRVGRAPAQSAAKRSRRSSSMHGFVSTRRRARTTNPRTADTKANSKRKRT